MLIYTKSCTNKHTTFCVFCTLIFIQLLVYNDDNEKEALLLNGGIRYEQKRRTTKNDRVRWS